jgi:hypothetical protein
MTDMFRREVIVGWNGNMKQLATVSFRITASKSFQMRF